MSQNRQQECIIFLLWVFIISSGGCLQVVARMAQEEWQVQVGDSQTYVIREFYTISNDYSYELSTWMLDEDNNNITIILKKGLIIRYDITFVSPNEARGKITFNGTITCQELSIYTEDSEWNIVRPSINNKTYWEENCKNRGFDDVTGDLIVTEITTEYSAHIYKWNWKTGWLNYDYMKVWNSTMITSVMEISLAPAESFFPLNVLAGGLILAAIILALLGVKKVK